MTKFSEMPTVTFGGCTYYVNTAPIKPKYKNPEDVPTSDGRRLPKMLTQFLADAIEKNSIDGKLLFDFGISESTLDLFQSFANQLPKWGLTKTQWGIIDKAYTAMIARKTKAGLAIVPEPTPEPVKELAGMPQESNIGKYLSVLDIIKGDPRITKKAEIIDSVQYDILLFDVVSHLKTFGYTTMESINAITSFKSDVIINNITANLTIKFEQALLPEDLKSKIFHVLDIPSKHTQLFINKDFGTRILLIFR